MEFQCQGYQGPQDATECPGSLFSLTLQLHLVLSLPEPWDSFQAGAQCPEHNLGGKCLYVPLARSGSVLTEVGMLAPPHPLTATWRGSGPGGVTTEGAWMTIDCLWQPMHQSAPPKISLTSRPLRVTGGPGIHSLHMLRVLTSRFPVGPSPTLRRKPGRVPRTTAPTSWQEGLLQAWLDARSLAHVPSCIPQCLGW